MGIEDTNETENEAFGMNLSLLFWAKLRLQAKPERRRLKLTSAATVTG